MSPPASSESFLLCQSLGVEDMIRAIEMTTADIGPLADTTITKTEKGGASAADLEARSDRGRGDQ